MGYMRHVATFGPGFLLLCLMVFLMATCSRQKDAGNSKEAAKPPEKAAKAAGNTHVKPSTLPTDLKGYSVHTWNGKKVDKAVAVKVLEALRKYNATFEELERDCLVSKEGIVMALAPAVTITFESTDADWFMVDLYEFSKDHVVVQFLSGKKYYCSSDKGLIKSLLACKPLY